MKEYNPVKKMWLEYGLECKLIIYGDSGKDFKATKTPKNYFGIVEVPKDSYMYKKSPVKRMKCTLRS